MLRLLVSYEPFALDCNYCSNYKYEKNTLFISALDKNNSICMRLFVA